MRRCPAARSSTTKWRAASKNARDAVVHAGPPVGTANGYGRDPGMYAPRRRSCPRSPLPASLALRRVGRRFVDPKVVDHVSTPRGPGLAAEEPYVPRLDRFEPDYVRIPVPVGLLLIPVDLLPGRTITGGLYPEGLRVRFPPYNDDAWTLRPLARSFMPTLTRAMFEHEVFPSVSRATAARLTGPPYASWAFLADGTTCRWATTRSPPCWSRTSARSPWTSLYRMAPGPGP